MKKKLCYLLLGLVFTIHFSCTPDPLVVTNNNSSAGGSNPQKRPPIANAGIDQVIFLPSNSASLNGTNSTDPDYDIQKYQWTKIFGPPSCNISDPMSSATQVTDLVNGVYDFELKVTDASGLFSKDTVYIIVDTITNNQHVDFYHQWWNDPSTCIININNIYSFFPTGVSYKIYIRYVDEQGSPGPWVLMSTTAGCYFYYEIVNGNLRIKNNCILCEWDSGSYDVRITWQ